MSLFSLERFRRVAPKNFESERNEQVRDFVGFDTLETRLDTPVWVTDGTESCNANIIIALQTQKCCNEVERSEEDKNEETEENEIEKIRQSEAFDAFKTRLDLSSGVTSDSECWEAQIIPDSQAKKCCKKVVENYKEEEKVENDEEKEAVEIEKIYLIGHTEKEKLANQTCLDESVCLLADGKSEIGSSLDNFNCIGCDESGLQSTEQDVEHNEKHQNEDEVLDNAVHSRLNDSTVLLNNEEHKPVEIVENDGDEVCLILTYIQSLITRTG